jgi:hypothetical protein
MTIGHRSGAQTIAFRANRPSLLYSPITEMHISKEPGMDEYLFITMAKLKADRLRLEREQRAQAPAEESRNQPVETHIESPGQARTSWFSRAPQWRAQS